jgi:hypothetical protein
MLGRLSNSTRGNGIVFITALLVPDHGIDREPIVQRVLKSVN